MPRHAFIQPRPGRGFFIALLNHFGALKAKGVLLIGAVRGIDRATAIIFGADGANLSYMSRTYSEVQAVAWQCGRFHGHPLALQCNVIGLLAPDQANRAVEAESSAVNILINNAGTSHI